MKNIFLLMVSVTISITAFAQETGFHLGLDFHTKYVWRGMEMMTADATPVLFPRINYQRNGFDAYVMGGTSLNGKYSEVDLGISYTYSWISIGLNDYYYPGTTGLDDRYFHFASKETGHWLEGVITVSPQKIPVYLLVSTFFYGADKNLDGRQAHSTYLEIGTHHDVSEHSRIMATLGTACNKSCYNGYERGLGVCNIGLCYTYELQIFKERRLPLSVNYIINPLRKKPFVNFSASFTF